MPTPYPEVSLLHFKNSNGDWQFKIVLKGKENEKMLSLLFDGCSDAYVAFENCKYLGKTKT